MLQCAFYEKEITPPLGCSIPGYFNVRLGKDVLDRLYAKSAVFKSGESVYVLVVVDGCMIYESLYRRVVKRIEEYIGIKPENVTLSCVHTHTGIPVAVETAEEIAPEAREAEEGYLEVVSKLIADCAVLAFYRLENCELYYGEGEERTITRCRDYIMKDGDVKTNPTPFDPNIVGPMSEADYSLPVLFVKGEDKKPKGAFITYSCHLDCVGGESYSGDYASILSKELKKHYGEDFVTVFMMSAGGNMNDHYIDRVDIPADNYVKFGKTLAGEAIKTIALAEPVKSDRLAVSYKNITINRTELSEEEIENARHMVKTVKMAEGVKLAADDTDPEQFELAMAKKLLAVLDEPEEFTVLVQVVKIGEFLLYVLPSEIYAEFAFAIKENSPSKMNMVATLCNTYLGYVPVRAAFRYKGIYPARKGVNLLSREAGYIIVENVLDMAEKLSN